MAMKLTGKEKISVKQACAALVFLQRLASRVLRWFDMSIYLQKETRDVQPALASFC
ncbi:hypothetical protein [Parasedimentitalea psychrophila]|uniref:Uncharacterized protein n=1 Tax=Parasedimentitalea psychrophila TaxID=2997337 RepID=A0A9Y2P433_9RHOB|nr:hypothetical protein [Parasedimentitalea psychrophila]WIY24899.1 hypothetical protein QPJ95_20760 [Parasedimentitalea psychrophila]